jgi:uncharacterized delta-60 repeat protein
MKYLLRSLPALLLLIMTVTARSQSALDGFDPNANGEVYSVVVQSDGKILIGGAFTSLSPNGGTVVTRNHIARLNTDGTLDTGFDPNANGPVGSIALQADGKILVGGGFSGANSIGGQTRNYMARLDPTTGLADSFNPGADNTIGSITIQTDGKILVTGNFASIGGQPRNRIARLDAMTGLADSFNPNPDGSVGLIAVQADSKILVTGFFTNIGGQPRTHIARLDATTGLADTFDANLTGGGYFNAIAVQADGKILVGGYFIHFGTPNIGGQRRNYLARLDPATGLADSFNPDPSELVTAIAVQADGKILVGGRFTFIGLQPRRGIARLDASTGLPDSFDPKVDPNQMGNSYVNKIAQQADGKVLIGGEFKDLAPNGGPSVTRNRIARMETDGRLDRTLDLGMIGNYVLATALQPDGKILIGGGFSTVLGVARNNIARLKPDGTLDTSFNPNASGIVRAIEVQLDGKILVGGSFFGANSIGGQTRNRIARLDPTTGLADAFDPNAGNDVNTIAVQADGKVLAGGFFTIIGGQPRNHIARLDAVSGAADSFDPNANEFIAAILVQADGKVLAGGGFSGANSIGGQMRNYIARLDAATGLADSFDPNANNSVTAMAVQGDGKILAGGGFSSIGGQPRTSIARLDPTTGLADSFDPHANGFVATIAVQSDGKVLAGGGFSGANSIGGQTRNFIARLNATTGSADSFDPNANNNVFAITLAGDGKILAGGFFTGANSIGGQSRTGFARLSSDTAASQSLAAMQSAVTWTRSGSAPQFTRVAFEFSTDNVNYTSLGNGTAAGSNWNLTGLNLPTDVNLYIRSRGYYRTGNGNASESISESVRNVVFVPPTITSANNATFTVGNAGNFRVTTTGIPTGASMLITESGALPAGVTFVNNNDGTATLAGTAGPGTSGSYPLLITANNGVMPNVTQNFTLTILAPPPTPTPTPTATATPGTLGNISTRLRVLAGDNALIGGMIATGTAPKKVIIRAIGPTLSDFGVPGALQDPTLELFQGSTSIASNDDWRQSSQQSEIQNSGLAPNKDAESAIIATLTPNQNYTAVVRGKNGETGVGVVEAFDLEQGRASKLGNISTRGFVDVDDNVMIAGLIVSPSNGTSSKVLVRALGPTLGDFGVPNALANPTLELVNSSGTVLRSNDNWKDDPQQRTEIEAANLAPGHEQEAALVQTVAPGAYTAIVRGSGRAIGVGLVEVYNIQ